MQTLVVGQPCGDPATGTEEGVEFRYSPGRPALFLRYRAPSPAEILSVSAGACEFALVVEGAAVFLLFRFAPALPWSDAPFSLFLADEEERAAIVAGAGAGDAWHDLLCVVLMESRTTVVAALRAVSFSAPFSRALADAVLAQAGRPWPGRAAYDAEIEALYARYPTPALLLERATARTRGGE